MPTTSADLANHNAHQALSESRQAESRIAELEARVDGLERIIRNQIAPADAQADVPVIEYLPAEQPHPRFPPEFQILHPAAWRVTVAGRVFQFPADVWTEAALREAFGVA